MKLAHFISFVMYIYTEVDKSFWTPRKFVMYSIALNISVRFILVQSPTFSHMEFCLINNDEQNLFHLFVYLGCSQTF